MLFEGSPPVVAGRFNNGPDRVEGEAKLLEEEHFLEAGNLGAAVLSVTVCAPDVRREQPDGVVVMERPHRYACHPSDLTDRECLFHAATVHPYVT